SPKPGATPQPERAEAASTVGATTAEARPHDFEVQKQIHQQIRNDPDYDDWEYGTEPLPHEAWSQQTPAE
ncbi:MAG: hypothetical protein ACKOOH_01430, partial [Cyanobium sp.]